MKAGSGVATFGLPDSPGVPSDFAKHTLTLPYNDVPKLRELFEARGKEIACAIIEPVVGNSGLIMPAPGYLEALREITAASACPALKVASGSRRTSASSEKSSAAACRWAPTVGAKTS